MEEPGNTFSQRSDQYALARPRYPRALFDWLLHNTGGRDAAWDCATGNGQAAVDLAPHFDKVQATDVSDEQISQGLKAANIVYSAQPAEHTSFAAQSFDLVTVAQALHWFDYARFWPELRRVAKPGALFCAWGYAWFDCDAEVLEQFVLPFRELVAPHWAANNRILWDGYRDADIAFPFERLTPPPLLIEEQWNIAQLSDYMHTWSAYKRAAQEPAKAAALDALTRMALARFESIGQQHISMPLAVVAGRIVPA
jgi:SAM-dependent methyltransferase